MTESQNMASLDELMQEKARLEQEINRIQRSERKNKIKEIIQMMQSYSITIEELHAQYVSSLAKYRNDITGQTWSGRGKKPAWVVTILENGGNLDDYLIK